MNDYIEVICVVAWCPFKGRKRVKPFDDTIYPSDQWVECAKEISENNPIGTKVKLWVKEKSNANPSKNADHLYSSYKWAYKILK
ncbi:TPA: hypothetical protein SMM93_001138 [Proteus mirabilis]